MPRLTLDPRRTRSRIGLSIALALLATTASCMSRPLASETPTTKVSFSAEITEHAVDKVDLLFMIDNSASMGDKQAYLKEAIPDLIHRLVTPDCIDDAGRSLGASTPDSTGAATCAVGDPEFPAVHDLHVGIVTTSLGDHGGNMCKVKIAGDPQHYDDKGHLIARVPASSPAADSASPSNYLAWRPPVMANEGKPLSQGARAIAMADELIGDFQDLVGGLGEAGCGLEAPLESWYRFLIQPDPHESLGKDAAGQVTLVGVDAVLLKQRRDFLRPDSLVAIVAVSDENDSDIDVRSYRGFGVHFFNDVDTFSPARGNAACVANPNDPNCQSCGAEGHATDPGCSPVTYSNNAKDPLNVADLTNLDNVNLRHVHMKQRYGIEPMYPMSRYVAGLAHATVPDRGGEYPAGAARYVGTEGCTNPLFAASLPDGTDLSPDALCNLKPGKRTPASVFFAHIGGVPFQLLLDADGKSKAKLSSEDWQRILGKNPEQYDFAGIDPHMVESVLPRAGLPGPTEGDKTDAVHGREWDTSKYSGGGSDLQYACTFDLAVPRDCTKGGPCDCPSADRGLPRSQVPPLCDPGTPTTQIKAKTYPTIRELELVKAMGDQGIAASLCPVHTVDNASKSDPLFGYRPAVGSLIARLKTGLTRQCVPHALSPDPQGKVQCLVLEAQPTAGSQRACDSIHGRSQPEPAVLARALADRHAAGAPDGFPICQVDQLGAAQFVGTSCAKSSVAGWCYVASAGAGLCPNAIIFSKGANQGGPTGATVSLLCVEPSSLPARE